MDLVKTRIPWMLALLVASISILVLSACSAPAAPAPAAPDKPAAAAPTAAPAAAPAKPAASGEKYPNRPIDFVVPWGAGGGADQLARTIGPLIEKELGVSLPVINVPGATGGTGAAKMLAAPADGYSFITYMADPHANVASGAAAYSYTDLSAIARVQQCPSFLFVNKASQFKSWKDLEDYAKANPGKLRVGITGEGSVDELSAAVLGMKGVKLNGVPYPSPGERYAALLGGHTELLYEQAGDVRQYIASGEMRPMIIFNQQRLADFPDVPTAKELGYEIYMQQFRSLVLKKGTDPARIKILADAVKKAVEKPEWAAFAKTQYMTPDSYMGPEEFDKYLAAEYETMVKLMKETGLRK